MAVSIVDLLFLRVAEHAVRFRAFAKFRFRFGFILRIAVGMPFQCGLPVSGLDLLDCRRPRHSQHFVIVLLRPLRHRNVLSPLSPSSPLLSMPDSDAPLHAPSRAAELAHEERSPAGTLAESSRLHALWSPCDPSPDGDAGRTVFPLGRCVPRPAW